MKNISDLVVKGKTVLIRVDFNVPLDEQGNITDDIRIRGVLPTINYALDEHAKVIIISHLGRPDGQRQEKYSLAPVAKRLSRLLEKEVKLAPDCIGPEVEAMVGQMAFGDVLLLENLRFHEEEKKNDPEFCRQLAKLADVYINDAFAVAHRAHASVVGVVEFFQECAAGFLLQKEMDYFHRSVSNPSRPLVAIVGGAKVSSKLGALRNMIDRVDKMIIGGAMANTFLKAQGYEVGTSRVEDDLLETANELVAKALKQGVKLYLPVDCIVADRFDSKAANKITTAQEVPKSWMILDIGPASTLLFGEALEDAGTIIWNGPMGAFEMDAFSRGTMAMVQKLAASQALTIVGGGDTDVAVHRAGESNNISYISTGGGAFLMLMEGKVLPGVAALEGITRCCSPGE
jgi:phosphoglycerate kinase